MNTQKYRLFNQLKNAIEADDILAATTRCIWEADSIAEAAARCRVPSLQEIQTFTQPVETDKRFIIGEDADLRRPPCRLIYSTSALNILERVSAGCMQGD